MPKNLIQYSFRATSIFFHYLRKGQDLELLEQSLKELQEFIRESEEFGENEELWFRFFENDTSANTIQNIIADLKNKTNRQYLIETLESCLSNKEIKFEVEVYFS